MSGGDWNDASVDHLAVPDDMDLAGMKALYDVWYRDEFAPAQKAGTPIDFVTFPQYLQQQGARPTTDTEIEEFWDC